MKVLYDCDVNNVGVIVETPKKQEHNHCEVIKGKEKVISI
jgi:hypothetical protein